MNKNTLMLGMAATLLTLSGCSTMHHGNFEKIRIVSTPPKALCKMYRESEGYMKSIATPGAIYLHRSTEPVRIVCSKKGYETTEVIAAPVHTTNLIANAANIEPAAVIIGGMIDVANGSNADLPEVVSVTLNKIE